MAATPTGKVEHLYVSRRRVFAMGRKKNMWPDIPTFIIWGWRLCTTRITIKFSKSDCKFIPQGRLKGGGQRVKIN